MRVPNLEQLSAVERTRRADEFNQLAVSMMLGRGSPYEAAKSINTSAAVMNVAKAAQGGTDMGDVADFAPMVSGFLTTLTNVSAFDAILADAHRVPLHSRVGLVTANATGASVGAFQPKPVSKLVVSNTPITEQRPSRWSRSAMSFCNLASRPPG